MKHVEEEVNARGSDIFDDIVDPGVLAKRTDRDTAMRTVSITSNIIIVARRTETQCS